MHAKDLFDEDSVRSLIGDDILKNLVQQSKKGMLLVDHKDIESETTSLDADIGDSLHNYFFIGNFVKFVCLDCWFLIWFIGEIS